MSDILAYDAAADVWRCATCGNVVITAADLLRPTFPAMVRLAFHSACRRHRRACGDCDADGEESTDA